MGIYRIFGVKIVISDIYRYFTYITDIFSEISAQARVLHSCDFLVEKSIFSDFSAKNRPFYKIFLCFSFSVPAKTDFSAIYRPKKLIFCSLLGPISFPGVPPVLENIFPRWGKQCPIEKISYEGYSTPKCTCNAMFTNLLWTTLRYFHWRYPKNIVDNPPIFSLDTFRKYYRQHFENTVDNPPIFSLDILRKYYGQHFENTVDNPPIFHWTYSDNNVGQPFDKYYALAPDTCNVPMQVKCDATAWYLLICMHACINIILTKSHVIQTRIKSCKLDFFV